MDRWMRQVVRGYRGMDHQDRRSCAVLVGLHLLEGSCDCSLQCCPHRHNLAAQPTSGVGVPLFVGQAVIGPVGLCANSVAQGMFYQLILSREEKMLVSNVEFKRCTNQGCPNPYREYEEDCCPGYGCTSVYTREETEVIAQERLFIRGVYRPARRWCCHGEHYYRQFHCRGRLTPPFTEVHHQLIHGSNGIHDHCPWRGCPYSRPRHSQSAGSTLWVRSELAGRDGENGDEPDPGDAVDPAGPAGDLRLDAIATGTRRWLDALDAATAHALREALAADESAAPESRDDPLVIADWVVGGRRSAIAATERERLRQAIQQALRERGLDA
jgi:hypothetical protein